MSGFQFNVGNTYSFSTLAPAILGETYSTVQLVGEMDFKRAMKEQDVQAKHRQIFPLLPPGTPDDPRQYTYLVFRDLQDRETVLGYPWIDQNTIVVATSQTLNLTIPNMTQQQAQNVSDALRLMGIRTFTLTLT